ncbi:hypothetical protein [Dehalogenimonas etheniformans]|uniref:Uncharacterized protein n=1 Tax=Dehalogenimonas etheniformans TaxID=1536648 RepID=A0A2P5P6Z1_9CHLR|nr:hypothetical protein [Dehalogenimonas etheniformans]PPD58039.1 hypothetical protein JP09_007040 [Dehalogenimonas etheniformans]QNT75389.1 hypothetical protein HX448_01125 [Dehalogenimonas etheniformans]
MKNRVTDKAIYLTAVAMAIAWVFAATLLGILHTNLAVRILIGMVPVAVLVYQVWLCFRYTLGQDEVQKRIILEGLSIAFMIALPVIFFVGFLMEAGVSLPFRFIDAGYFLEVMLVIGYTIAWRHYQ